MNVLIINHYAANRGDRAVLYFVVRELVRNAVSNITVSTHDASFWPDGLNINGTRVNFVPWAQYSGCTARDSKLGKTVLRASNKFRRTWAFSLLRTMLRSRRHCGWLRPLCTRGFDHALAKADLVIGTGGHHIQTRFTPESLSALTYDMGLAVLCRKPLVLWSQTIGPLDFLSKENEAFARSLIDGAHQVFVRDDKSLTELKSIGARLDHVRQTYDSVIGLNDEIPRCVPISEREKVVGISVYSAESRSLGASEEYFRSLAALVDSIVMSGHRVRFFPMEMQGAAADDRPCIRELIMRVERKEACEVVEQDLDTITHLKAVAKCRCFVGHKTHSQIFALAVGTPLLALAYHEKTIDFMNQYGLKSNCVPDSAINPMSLTSMFQSMNTELDCIAKRQFDKSRDYGEAVRREFSKMLRAGIN